MTLDLSAGAARAIGMRSTKGVDETLLGPSHRGFSSMPKAGAINLAAGA
jgi:hypothetical protein